VKQGADESKGGPVVLGVTEDGRILVEVGDAVIGSTEAQARCDFCGSAGKYWQVQLGHGWALLGWESTNISAVSGLSKSHIGIFAKSERLNLSTLKSTPELIT
jgi:hypothetical protein